jgi:hypothetical protein
MHEMLATVFVTTICMGPECEGRWVRKWYSDMILNHVTALWRFLRIGAGAETIKAAFCTICPDCGDKKAMPGISEDDDIAVIKEYRNKIDDITLDHYLLKICSWEEVSRYFQSGRALIEVGRTVTCHI